mgnify:CR=1 FL=1|jgi:hypothetical protein
MLLVRGWAGESALTGTIYEEGESAPSYQGSPDTDAAYVWICDEFYEVESGGSTQVIDGEEIRIAFESPMPRGFDTEAEALEAAEDHLRTQFARLGVDRSEVEIEVLDENEDPVDSP